MFCDILYYTGRHGKAGLRALRKNSFVIKTSAEDREYIEITFNQVSKKNQGDQTSIKKNTIHNERHIIAAQPDEPAHCPVNSFKLHRELAPRFE